MVYISTLNMFRVWGFEFRDLKARVFFGRGKCLLLKVLRKSRVGRRLLNLHGNFTRFQGAFTKDFGLRDQIRRASVSIMSNIAEGFERDGNREFLQFLAVQKARVAK